MKPSEITICESEVLSWYDDAIATLYQDIREPKDGDVSDISFQVRKSQRFWLEQRNLCGDDVSCIEATQRERLAALGELTQHDIKESHFDYYGNWRIKTEDMGGNFLLVATSKGEAFLSLQSVRKNQGAHLCQLQFKGGRIFQNSIVWPNQTSLDGERCMIILSRQTDEETLEEKLLVEQSECQPYWCGAFGYFEGLYERRATN
ncbi:MAG: lysozyme inhibitor LprI family protein [Alphaproteobacteria bacterium]